MRYLSLKKGMAWNFLGWFLFVLICLIIAIMMMGKFSGSSFNLLDKLFSNW